MKYSKPERLDIGRRIYEGELKRFEAAEEYGLGYNLVAGANLAGFKKVATAMMEQGIF